MISRSVATSDIWGFIQDFPSLQKTSRANFFKPLRMGLPDLSDLRTLFTHKFGVSVNPLQIWRNRPQVFTASGKQEAMNEETWPESSTLVTEKDTDCFTQNAAFNTTHVFECIVSKTPISKTLIWVILCDNKIFDTKHTWISQLFVLTPSLSVFSISFESALNFCPITCGLIREATQYSRFVIALMSVEGCKQLQLLNIGSWILFGSFGTSVPVVFTQQTLRDPVHCQKCLIYFDPFVLQAQSTGHFKKWQHEWDTISCQPRLLEHAKLQ